MKTTNQKQREEISWHVARARKSIEDFNACVATHGPTYAMLFKAEEVMAAEVLLSLVNSETNPGEIKARAMQILSENAYAHANTKDAERSVARQVIAICDRVAEME